MATRELEPRAIFVLPERSTGGTTKTWRPSRELGVVVGSSAGSEVTTLAAQRLGAVGWPAGGPAPPRAAPPPAPPAARQERRRERRGTRASGARTPGWRAPRARLVPALGRSGCGRRRLTGRWRCTSRSVRSAPGPRPAAPEPAGRCGGRRRAEEGGGGRKAAAGAAASAPVRAAHRGAAPGRATDRRDSPGAAAREGADGGCGGAGAGGARAARRTSSAWLRRPGPRRVRSAGAAGPGLWGVAEEGSARSGRRAAGGRARAELPRWDARCGARPAQPLAPPTRRFSYSVSSTLRAALLCLKHCAKCGNNTYRCPPRACR